MTGAVLQRQFPAALSDACSALDKMTGGRWSVSEVGDPAADPANEPVEAVRMGVGGLSSPRFLLAVSQVHAAGFAGKVTAVFGIAGMDVPAVLAETANIVISAVLNQMGAQAGQSLIVTAPQAASGPRASLVSELLGARGRGALRARLTDGGGALDVLVCWDA